MAKSKVAYYCSECGGQSTKWQGQCAHCFSWNTLSEELIETKGSKRYASLTQSTSLQKLNDVKTFMANMVHFSVLPWLFVMKKVNLCWNKLIVCGIDGNLPRFQNLPQEPGSSVPHVFRTLQAILVVWSHQLKFEIWWSDQWLKRYLTFNMVFISCNF